jgi:uncharacterized protein (DUF2267 family)
MTRPTNETELMQRRVQRHESHTRSTYAAFIRHLCEVGKLEPSLAECAAVAVLRALERRILPAEAKDLEAQLPRRLVDFLPPLEQRPQRPRRFGKEEFLQTVADDLERPVEEMEPLVRAVFRAMRDLISEGEADDVASNLPPLTALTETSGRSVKATQVETATEAPARRSAKADGWLFPELMPVRKKRRTS